MRQTAAQAPFSEALGPILAKRQPAKSLDDYYRLLSAHAASVDIWLTIYHHRLPGGIDDPAAHFRGKLIRVSGTVKQLSGGNIPTLRSRSHCEHRLRGARRARSQTNAAD